ncbi:MAG: transcriptional coactivator p15/PC4 family protein [Dehalococcoidales bacterium]
MESEEFGILIHSFQKNSKEQIRIMLNEYKGTKYIDIRIFFMGKDREEYFPSKKGITLSENKYNDLLEGCIILGETLGYNIETVE